MDVDVDMHGDGYVDVDNVNMDVENGDGDGDGDGAFMVMKPMLGKAHSRPKHKAFPMPHHLHRPSPTSVSVVDFQGCLASYSQLPFKKLSLSYLGSQSFKK